MSRKEDFKEQANKYAAKCGGTTQEKCAAATDYSAGCEYGYQYCRERAMKVLHDDLFVSDDIITLLNRIMED